MWVFSYTCSFVPMPLREFQQNHGGIWLRNDDIIYNEILLLIPVGRFPKNIYWCYMFPVMCRLFSLDITFVLKHILKFGDVCNRRPGFILKIFIFLSPPPPPPQINNIPIIQAHRILRLISSGSTFDWSAHPHRLNLIHPHDRSPRRNICLLIYHNSDRKVSN